jgi:fucose 4-O-acetylase-like acetyltransferase
MDQSGRLHSLDNLRALMMWLGIVLHAAVNHFTLRTAAIPWRDHDTTPLADISFIFIHSFRMPVFFILAGFFVALLVKNRRYDGMLKHRLRRLALPFAVFWPILFVLTGFLVMVYLNVMAHGTLGFDAALMPKESAGRATISTLHLWFIYYLFWFCLLTVGFGKLEKYIPAPLKSKFEQVCITLGSRWWGFIVLALPLAAIGSTYSGGMVAPDGSFIPSIRELIYNGLFFVFGCYLYRSQDSLLPHYARSWWKYAIAGGLFFFVSLTLFGTFAKNPKAIPNAEAWIALAFNCASCLWSFALIGLFVRYLSRQNAVLQYVSESSYWVYLVHMLGTIGFGALIYNLPLGAIAKMGLNIFLTTAACLVTYRLLVRNTRIGVLLNGRRGSTKLAVAGVVPVS